MVCICSFVCSERESCLLQERHKRTERERERERERDVSLSNGLQQTGLKTHVDCASNICISVSFHQCCVMVGVCIYWLHMAFIQTPIWSNLVLQITVSLGWERKRQDGPDLTMKRGGGVFRTKISTPRTPTPRGQGSPFIDSVCGSDKLVYSFSLLQCWCFLSSPSLSAAICLTVFSQSSTHDNLYSFSL
jgi:hypothetical protein